MSIQKLSIFFGLFTTLKNTNNFSGKLLTLNYKEGRIKSKNELIIRSIKNNCL